MNPANPEISYYNPEQLYFDGESYGVTEPTQPWLLFVATALEFFLAPFAVWVKPGNYKDSLTGTIPTCFHLVAAASLCALMLSLLLISAQITVPGTCLLIAIWPVSWLCYFLLALGRVS